MSHPLNVSIRFKLFFMHGFGLGSWSQVDVGFSAAPRATLLFSDLPEIETELPEIETDLHEIETALLKSRLICLKSRLPCLKSRFCLMN